MNFREFVAALDPDQSQGLQMLMGVTHLDHLGGEPMHDDIDGLLRRLAAAVDQGDTDAISAAAAALEQLAAEFEAARDLA